METLEPRNSARPRVMVAGMGAITALGPTATSLWNGVRNARVAIRRVRQMPMVGFGTRVGAEVDPLLEPRHEYRRPSGHREPAVDFALMAAEEAIDSAGIPQDAVAPERWAVVLGTCNAGLESAEMWYLRDVGWDTTEPEMLLLYPPQALAEAVAGAFGIKGPVISVNTACASGANAIGYAAELLATGQADVALAGGTDALSQILFAGFTALESLSPTSAAPYSRGRQGLSLGEGSGMLVLVREDLSRELGLRRLAEFRGYGLSADGYHPTAPHPEGEGAARAVRAAMSAGGIRPEMVHYINGHGTGTPKNDSAETNAIRASLGEAADRVLVSSTKSMIGHLLGAAGAVEAIVTVGAIEHQVAPPTANFGDIDPECTLDYVPNQARPATIDVALSNNFAFGGQNACLAFARPDALDEPPPTPPHERVVVTGLAALTSAGSDLAAILEAVGKGRTDRVASPNRVQRIEVDPSPFLTPRETRRMDRIGVLSVIAAKRALADAGIIIDEASRCRTGLVFGTGMGPVETMEAFGRPLVSEGPEAANPAQFPNTVFNAAAGQVGIHTGVVGHTATLTVGNAAGSSALHYGSAIAATGRADAVVCLAADMLSDTVVRAYRDLGTFAQNPDFVLSEGAAALLLERQSYAISRGARVHGEILGSAITCDASGISRFDRRGRGIERAMRLALERAGLPAMSVAQVWAGYSGARAADTAERAAIRRVLPSQVEVIAPKLAIGDPLAPAGLIAAALALTAGGRSEPAVILVNSSSLGGTHVSIVLRAGG
jgi:3-oxoacyl-[acyl-carrier-protein] synthase II